MAETADVVIIGAGVMGSSVSYELARAGMSVVVLDKGPGIGAGSTSASSAVMRYHYSTAEGVSAAWESTRCWQSWADHLQATESASLASLVQCGVVMLDAPIIDRDRTEGLFREVGVPFEYWRPDELRERVPGIDVGRYWPPKNLRDEGFWGEPDGELGALYTPDGGFIDDPMLATQNLADAARRLHVDFRLRQSVTEVSRRGENVAGVVTADGTHIAAPIVVNCAGPWSGRINQLAGVGDEFTVSVRPMRQEVHHVEAPPGFSTDDQFGPVISDSDLGTYLRPAAGNVLLVGGAEPECDPLEWIDDPDEYNPNRTLAVFEAQVTRAARRLPELRIPNTPSGIAGVYDVTPDWTPIYDRTDLGGFFVAIGTSGNQFKNAPLVGQMLSSLIHEVTNGRDHDADPHTFVCEHTGNQIDLGAFSRKRALNPYSSHTVLG